MLSVPHFYGDGLVAQGVQIEETPGGGFGFIKPEIRNLEVAVADAHGQVERAAPGLPPLQDLSANGACGSLHRVAG